MNNELQRITPDGDGLELTSSTAVLSAIHGNGRCCFQVFDDDAKRKDPKLAKTIIGTLSENESELRNFASLGAGIF